jgi:hypothetical protein
MRPRPQFATKLASLFIVSVHTESTSPLIGHRFDSSNEIKAPITPTAEVSTLEEVCTLSRFLLAAAPWVPVSFLTVLYSAFFPPHDYPSTSNSIYEI